MDSLNILFTGKNKVETRREPVPELKADQVLVETSKTLISTGTECICLGRKFEPGTGWDAWVKYPFTPGYSNAGTVLKVGAGVTTVKAGDRVAARIPHRQFYVAPAAEVLPIPDGVSDEAATWFGLATIVQIGIRRANHVLGDTVVVIGLGLLGQLVVQYVRLMGAQSIIAIDTAEPRLQMAQKHGASDVLQVGVQDAKEKVFALTKDRGADVVYDVTGHASVLSPALGLARRFGTLLLLGDTGTPSEQRLTQAVVGNGVSILGAHDGHPEEESTAHQPWGKRAIGQLFFHYVRQGQMNVEDLITHRYTPEQSPEAYEMLMTNRDAAMGVVFDWSGLKQT